MANLTITLASWCKAVQCTKFKLMKTNFQDARQKRHKRTRFQAGDKTERMYIHNGDEQSNIWQHSNAHNSSPIY